MVVRAHGVAGPGTAHAAVVSFATIDARRVHGEAIEALVHDPGAPQRRVPRARRRPRTVEATLAVVVVVVIADVAGRGAWRAPAPFAELSAAAAGGGTRGKPPRCALLAFAPTRLGLNPPGGAVDAGRCAGGRTVRARVALVARSLPRGRSDAAGLANRAFRLAGRGLMPSRRTLRTTRRAVGRAVLARVTLDAVDLVRRVGSRWAGEAVDAEGRIGPLLAGRARNLIAEQDLGLATRARRAGRRTERRVSARRTVVAAHRARPGAEGVDGAERAARRAMLARVGPGGALGTGSEAVGAVRAGAAKFARRRVRWRRAGSWRRPRRRIRGWGGRRRGRGHRGSWLRRWT